MGGPGLYDLACARADLVVMVVVGRAVVESLRFRLRGEATSSESSSESCHESSSMSSASDASRQSA